MRKNTQNRASTKLDDVHAVEEEIGKCATATGRNAKMLVATVRERRFAKRKRAVADQSRGKRRPSAATMPLNPANAAATSASATSVSCG